MASGFPGSIDSFTNPLAASALNSPSHAGQHQDLNDAVNKVETYMGLVKVIPTSVTGGTLAANGTITVGNAVSSVVVSGAFSSLYDNYRIIYAGGTTSTSGYWTLKLGASTTTYYGAFTYGVYSSGAYGGLGLNNGASFAYVGGLNQNQTSLNIELLNPFLSKFTYVTALNIISGNNYGQFVGDHETASSYADFTIAPSAGTVTGGTLRIYGYRN